MRTATLRLLRDGAHLSPFAWSDLATSIDALRAEAGSGALHVTLIGAGPERGDPTQSPHLLRLLATTAPWGWRLALITSETALRAPARLDALAAAGLGELSLRAATTPRGPTPEEVLRGVAHARERGLTVTRAVAPSADDASLRDAVAWCRDHAAPLRPIPPSQGDASADLRDLFQRLEVASEGACPDLRLEGWHAREPGAHGEAPRRARSVDLAALRAGALPPDRRGGLLHPGAAGPSGLDSGAWRAWTAHLEEPVAADLPACLGGLGRVLGVRAPACAPCPLAPGCGGLPAAHHELVDDLRPPPGWLGLPTPADVHVWISSGHALDVELLRSLSDALRRAGARVTVHDAHDDQDRPLPPADRLLHPRRGADAPARRAAIDASAWQDVRPGRDLTLVPASWLDRARARWPSVTLASPGAPPPAPARALPAPPDSPDPVAIATWANRAAQGLLRGEPPAALTAWAGSPLPS
jgi:hypothetical protein